MKNLRHVKFDHSQRWDGDTLTEQSTRLLRNGKRLFFLRWWDGKTFRSFCCRKRRGWLRKVRTLKHKNWMGGEMSIPSKTDPPCWFYGYDSLPLRKDTNERPPYCGPMGMRCRMMSFNPNI